MWARFDSGACRCVKTTSRAKKLGVEIIPWNKIIVNMARVPMKIDGQVYFSFRIKDSRGAEILSKPYPILVSEEVDD